jgi:hypothetical protein
VTKSGGINLTLARLTDCNSAPNQQSGGTCATENLAIAHRFMEVAIVKGGAAGFDAASNAIRLFVRVQPDTEWCPLTGKMVSKCQNKS